MGVVLRSRISIKGVLHSVGWLIDSDGDIIDEVDVCIDSVVELPDDQIVRLIDLLLTLARHEEKS